MGAIGTGAVLSSVYALKGAKAIDGADDFIESYADLMSPEDAKKYLEFLENGSTAGLTPEELAGIDKLDELLALEKVDWDDVVRIRADVYEGGGDRVKFNIDVIRPKLKTEPDTAFFWSGKTDGVGGAEVAADIAKGKGGVTLELTIEVKDITMPEWDFNDPSSMDAWDMASAAYAEQVSGEVRAVVGTKLRPDNIWENIELPRLMENPNVTKITIIDPKTGIEKVIFER